MQKIILRLSLKLLAVVAIMFVGWTIAATLMSTLSNIGVLIGALVAIMTVLGTVAVAYEFIKDVANQFE